MAAALVYPRLAVLGGTGPTGVLAIKRALALGHHVTAIVRSPEKLKDIVNENLEVVKGNIFEADSLAQCFEGKDAVLSFLGAHGTSIFNPTTLYSESMKAIMAAMERSSVNKIVTLTSWCTVKEPGSPKLMEWFLKPLFLNGFVPDMDLMENMLKDSSLNYTVIRPPGLSNDGARNKYEVVEGQFVIGGAWYISRDDVAECSLKVLQTTEWDRKAVAVGYKK